MTEACPYRSLPPYALWDASVANRNASQINPHDGASFVIDPKERVASAGSCFAQHIAGNLPALGLNYFVAERGPPFLSEPEKRALGYGIYSARYGNIYTALQLAQLFERACGTSVPREPVWKNRSDRFVDPLRPAAQPGGFRSEGECLADRELHLSHVRALFEQMDVFVFTLGLTEAWISREDGTVLPACPGCGLGGTFDDKRYRFVNFSVPDVVEHLDAFLANVFRVNPRLRVILTVSPVPLVATFEKRHVMQATVYSKSVLRIACEEIIRKHPQVHYFAAFEIVTACADEAPSFEADRRSVTAGAVDRVIDCFRQQFTGSRQTSYQLADAAADAAAVPAATSSKTEPMCDENEIMAAMLHDRP